MPVVIDGDNLLGTWPGVTRTDDNRLWLAGIVAKMAVSTHRRIVVVFDGRHPGDPDLRSDVIFAGPNRTADDAISSLLASESEPTTWKVVTSDRRLASRCRNHGAKVERCDLFRKRLHRQNRPEKPEGKVDLEEWIDYFGIDPNS